jgi:monothiol glutaredoxin
MRLRARRCSINIAWYMQLSKMRVKMDASTRFNSKRRSPVPDSDSLRAEITRELAANTILVYGKGTKDAPRCGFTAETIQFFNQFGYPFEVIDVLENMPKREALSQMTDWPTLPKVFIDGQFLGDTDILGPMAQKGELTALLTEAFEKKGVKPSVVL